ncbi:MAG: NAD(P)/FAD-dependent oxidoreductase [Chloroflexi bacterium]|nr:NAD(P)/FAD-dependent oxidoreductase [Chloroflexota bacterium]
MSECDVLIIGAGPNGLELAAYLAKAGLNVLVLEKRHEAGGGLATENVTLGDYIHNTHAVYMMMVDYAPLYQDLNLAQYRLKHIRPSLQFALPLSDGKCLCVYTDLEKTCQSIAAFSKKDAEAYRELYHAAARAMAEFIGPATFAPPVPALDQVVKLQATETGREIIDFSEKSPLEIVNERFENEHVKALMLYLSTHWGVAYNQPGLGYLVMLYLNRAHNYHLVAGGTHMVAQALHKAVIEHGGMVKNSQYIKRIIVENGAATGVEMVDGSVVKARKAVVSTLDPHQTFLKLVGKQNLDKDFAERIEGWQWEKYSLTGVHLAMEEAPNFTAAANNPDINNAFVYVLGYETMQDLINDYETLSQNKLSDKAAFNCCFPSVHDPLQAPPGRHTGLISRFTPYDLEGNRGTIKFKDHLAEQCIATLRKYAPNVTTEKILWNYVSTPYDVQNKFTNMVKGSIKHGEYAPLQMGYLRPNEECSQNRTPVKNLFVAGASTYPGGCVIWGPGYLAANTIAEDLGVKKWWTEPAMVTKAKQQGLL